MSAPILVCDPDEAARQALRLILRGAGYATLETSSGAEALQVAISSHPQALIVETELADIRGPELCRCLHECVAAPVLVLSSQTREGAKIAALESGADDYLTKPFSGAELVARLHAVLRRATSGEQRLEREGVTIDFDSHLVVVDGTEVHLTPIELSLLHVLAASAGPVSHMALARRVWGSRDGDFEPRLRTHIRRLRTKLNGKTGHPLIHTEIGVGYKFAATHRNGVKPTPALAGIASARPA